MSTKRDRESILNYLNAPKQRKKLRDAFNAQNRILSYIQTSSLPSINDDLAMRKEYSNGVKKLEEKVKYDLMSKNKHNITISQNVQEYLKNLYIRLLFLSSEGFANSYYKNLADRLVNINQNQTNQILEAIRNELQNRIDRKKKYRGNSHKKEYIKGTIRIIDNLLRPPQRGGSKKGPKVKGKRVLKNGTMAGYVRQKDGSYRWRFLKRR